MRASKYPESIIDLISREKGEKVFEIPVYQRNYDWAKENCNRFFDDLLQSIKSGRQHYFGNIYYDLEDHNLSGYSRIILIDGQQRITSAMLLIAAIRDAEPDAEKRAQIDKLYLKNSDNENEFKVRLKQVETDRDVFEKIIRGELKNIDKSATVYKNYHRFQLLVKDAGAQGITAEMLLRGLQNLKVMSIDLESDKPGMESAQIIFESINATGKELSPADLLRNFLLMGISHDDQEHHYKHFWLPIEKNIGNKNVSDFLRRYLTMRALRDIQKNTEYKEFKRSYGTYFPGGAADALDELLTYSKYYKWIKQPGTIEKTHPETASILRDLDDVKMVPATPTIMWLLCRADAGEISFDDVNNTLNVIASWSFRARITDIITTGDVGNILTTKILELLQNKPDDGKPYAEYLRYELSNYPTRDIYPTDEQFIEKFYQYDFYKSYRKYVQKKLAEKASKDAHIVMDSIEHIMPQTLDGKKWPNITPAEHAAWVNTIGNLTPMNQPDNSTNSNNSFADKIEQIKDSDWKITREINTEGDWDIAAIKERGKKLARAATKIWEGPMPRTREITVKKPETKLKKVIEWVDGFDLPNLIMSENNVNNRKLMIFWTEKLNVLSNADAAGEKPLYHYEINFENKRWENVRLIIEAGFNTAVLEQIMQVSGRKPYQNWKTFKAMEWQNSGELEDDDRDRRELEEILAVELPEFERQVQEGLDG